MIALKAGVTIGALRPPMVVGLLIVDGCFSQYGFSCVITSGDDGAHKVGSLHAQGLALDFRTKHVPRTALDKVLTLVSERLGTAEFDWILEHRDEAGEHLHVEYDPKPVPPRAPAQTAGTTA